MADSVNDMSCEEWDASYGKVYQNLIDNGLEAIMAGHIMQPAYTRHFNPGIKDEDIMPATLSPELIEGLLRGKLGFNGMVLTDASHMVGLTCCMKRSEMLPHTIAAGVDMFLFFNEMDEDFASKKVAMLFAGHSGISAAYNKLTDEYGVAYLPKGPRASGYVSYLMDEYSYVIPAAYSDMAADLLVLLSKLHRLPKGYTVDDEFRDEWIRYFKDADAYKMFKTLHDGSVKQVWDGTNKMAPNAGATTYASAFGRLFQGELTPGAFIDTYQSAFKASVNDSAKKVTYTGPLK